MKLWNVPARIFSVAAASLLLFLLGVNIYRAATQALTSDEALTFNLYLSQPLSATFTNYDANNHVLFTLLARFCMRWGRGEIVLRITALFGGLLYFVTVYRMSCFLFGRRWLFLLSVVFLSLNPYVLDFLSAARGYGLAIALWFTALYYLLRYLEENESRHLPKAGWLMGLAVSANLTLLFPCAAMVLAVFLLHAKGLRSIEFWTIEFWTIVDKLCLPAVVVSFVILIVPLSHASADNFYVGAPSLNDTLHSIWDLIIDHHPTQPFPLHGWLRVNGPQLVVMFTLLTALAVIRQLRAPRFLTLSIALTLVLLVAAHQFAHVLYPAFRTGLYFVPFVSLLWLSALGAAPWKFLQIAGSAVLCILLVFYVQQWNTSVYTEWRYAAGIKQVAKIVRERKPQHVACSWELAESLNYYRARYWHFPIPAVTREGAAIQADLYVLLPRDYPLMAQLQLREIFRDDASGEVVALPTAPHSSSPADSNSPRQQTGSL